MAKYILLGLIAVVIATRADDIREKVTDGSMTPAPETSIDPDSHIYGIPFGTSENDFIATHGKPTGYIRLREKKAGMLYGTNHIFIFSEGVLSGVRIGEPLVDWIISQALEPNNVFRRRQWELTNGIQERTTMTKVKDILGDKLLTNEYNHNYYLTEYATVRLFFSHFASKGDGDDALNVSGILVEKR